MGRFEGKVVVITGASSGIGESTALAFAKEGANMTIVGRNAERLSAVATDCRENGAKVLELVCELGDFESLESLISKTADRFGAIDILVNSAAGACVSPVEKLQLEDYERMLQVNLRAPIFLCKYALPHLRKTRGCVVNVSGVFGQVPLQQFAIYCTSKAALDHFTRGFASECGSDGVRVNCVNPGIVGTAFWKSLQPKEAANNLRTKCLNRQPLGTIQRDEVADSIMYLCEADGVTGTTLVIDRGLSLQQ